jgi:hypothetical protein
MAPNSIQASGLDEELGSERGESKVLFELI